MCCWCSCLECIHNIPPLNLLFLQLSSDPALPVGEEGAALSMASISIPYPVPPATEDAENIRKAVQGIPSLITGLSADAVAAVSFVSIHTPFFFVKLLLFPSYCWRN